MVQRSERDGHRVRPLALEHYRAAGFTPDDFARVRAARMAMTDALTRTEDFLELRRGEDAHPSG